MIHKTVTLLDLRPERFRWFGIVRQLLPRGRGAVWVGVWWRVPTSHTQHEIRMVQL